MPEELGQQFRNDVPQVVKPDVMLQHNPDQPTPAQMIPLPKPGPTRRVQSGDAGIDYESREVPASADEPGLGETCE